MAAVTLKLVAAGDDQLTYKEVGSDLAWESAVHAASLEGIELGSDDFVEALTHLQKKYDECADSYGHLRFIATRTLKILTDVGMAFKYPDNECMCENHLTNHIDSLIGVLMSSMTSIYSVGPSGWMTNEEWMNLSEDERTTFFTLNVPNNIPREGDDEITHD